MQYPECETCKNCYEGMCTLGHPCYDGPMGLSDYEPKTESEQTINE